MEGKLKTDLFLEDMLKFGFIDINSLILKEKTSQTLKGNSMLLNNPIFGGSLQDCSFINFTPQFIFRPVTRIQIQFIVSKATHYEIPITFAGGKTGLSGGYANPYIIVDLEHLKTIDKPLTIDEKNKTIIVDQNVLVSDAITQVKYTTSNRLLFPIQPSSSLKLPVRIGGIISTNASGLTSGKLGATKEWIEKVETLLPTGEFVNIFPNDSIFSKIIGGMGRYGVIMNAQFRLEEVPSSLAYTLLYGENVHEIFEGLQEVQDKNIFPLTSEFIMSSKALPGSFGALFQEKAIKWAILLKGNSEILEKFETILKKFTNIHTRPLNLAEFKIYIKERASIATLSLPNVKEEYILFPGFEDILMPPNKVMKTFDRINEIVANFGFNPFSIGYGHINFRKGKGMLLHIRLPVPISDLYDKNEEKYQKIATVLANVEYVITKELGIISKAEHSIGVMEPWHSTPEKLNKWREDIGNKFAFPSPHLIIYDSLRDEELKHNDQSNSKEFSIDLLTRLYCSYLMGKIEK
jgi:FAD binding domain